MADKFELRCYAYLDRMQPQYAAFVGTITQGDLPTVTAEAAARYDEHVLAVELQSAVAAVWSIVDTIADNASYGGFTLGPWDRSLVQADLGALAMTIHHN